MFRELWHNALLIINLCCASHEAFMADVFKYFAIHSIFGFPLFRFNATYHPPDDSSLHELLLYNTSNISLF